MTIIIKKLYNKTDEQKSMLNRLGYLSGFAGDPIRISNSRRSSPDEIKNISTSKKNRKHSNLVLNYYLF